MVVPSNQVNLEDAAHVANEYIYSIDNLPHEVEFLLEEIQHKDDRACDIQQEIEISSSKYLRHSLRPTAQASSTPANAAKFESIPAQIATLWTELKDLNAEKVMLAQKIYNLMRYTQSRLAIELTKVQTLEGRHPEPQTKPNHSTVATQLTNSLNGTLETPASSSSTCSSSRRKRKAPCSSPPVSAASPLPHTLSHSQPTDDIIMAPVETLETSVSRQFMDDDEQKDPEDDLLSSLDAEDGDDDKLYCYCQKPSYGDMIACDNQSCIYEWFHLTCIGLTNPLPRTWYCETCTSVRSTRKRK